MYLVFVQKKWYKKNLFVTKDFAFANAYKEKYNKLLQKLDKFYRKKAESNPLFKKKLDLLYEIECCDFE